MEKLAPIALFAYNRTDHLKQTVESLKLNYYAENSELFIFIDGPKDNKDKMKVNSVREYCREITGFQNLIIEESEINKGLATSIISGVSNVLIKYENIIVLEDDLITDNYFLDFMNRALKYYSRSKNVFSVTGFNYPINIFQLPSFYKPEVYFVTKASSLGWGTWRDKWLQADWNIPDFPEFKKNKNVQREFNKGGSNLSSMLINQMENDIDSWAIRWNYNIFIQNGICLYPKRSLLHHIGWDGSGVHASVTNKFDNILYHQPFSPEFILNPYIDKTVQKRFRNIFKKRILPRLKNKIHKHLSTIGLIS